MREYYRQIKKIYLKINAVFSVKKSAKLIFGISLIIIFSLILLLNLRYPLYADDWVYIMKFPEETAIQNFRDIIITQYHHYFNWGGRSIVHIIAQSLLLFESPLNDILNSLVYIYLSLLIYYIGNYNRSININIFLWTNVLLWLFIPSYGPTVLNITTSSNYLWGTAIIITFLLPYCLYFLNGQSSDSILKNTLFFIGGILAGWTNENMSIAMIFMIVSFLFIIKKKKGRIYQWNIYGLLGSIIGAVFLLFAPGNILRYQKEKTNISETPQYLQGIYNVLGGSYHNILTIIILFLAILACYLFTYKKETIKVDTKLQLSLLFLITAIIAMGAMIASPIFPDRAWFGIIILIIIGIIILHTKINSKNIVYQCINSLILVISACFCMSQYIIYNNDLKQIDHIVKEREIYLKIQKQQGYREIIFDKPIIPLTKFTDISDFSSDSTFWLNRQFSKYHKLNSMQIKPKQN